MQLPPEHSTRQRIGPVAAAGFGLMLAIGGALSSPEGAPIAELAMRVWVPLPDWLVVGAVAALSIATLIFIVIAAPWRRRMTGEDENERYHEPQKISPLLAVFLLLLALTPGAMLGGAIWWLAHSDVSVLPLPSGIHASNPPDASRMPLQGSEERPSRPTSPVTTGLIGTLALLVGFGSLGLVLWLCFGDRLQRQPGGFAGPPGPLAGAIEDSLDDLRREPDARTAIIRIYHHFERALGAADLPRRPWQTPVEFMRAVLGKLPVPAAAVQSLTGLFELARFSRHPVGAAERDGAWRSLLEIRAALEPDSERPDAAAS